MKANSNAMFLLVMSFALSASAGDPQRLEFTVGWNSAVARRNTRQLWELLDASSQERIVAGVKRSRERASQDAAFAALLKAANSSTDLGTSTEESVLILLASNLDHGDLRDDGLTKSVHLERGAWRAHARPVGFVASERAPVTLALRLSDERLDGDSEKRRTDTGSQSGGIAGFRIQPPLDGRSRQQISDDCTFLARRIAKQGKVWVGFEPEAARVLNHYARMFTDPAANVDDVSFVVGKDGSITPILSHWSNTEFRRVPQTQPQLSFGEWPH